MKPNFASRTAVLLLVMSLLLAAALPAGGPGTPFSFAGAQAQAAAEAPQERYGATNKSGVNVRRQPGAKAAQVRQLPNTGSAVVILGEEINSAGERWFQVRLSDGKEGYIRADLLTEISAAEYAQASASTGKSKNTAGSEGKAVQRTQTSPSSGSGTMVWIPTISGKRYHKTSRCSGMKGPAKVTVEEARSRGFTPCKNCY